MFIVSKYQKFKIKANTYGGHTVKMYEKVEVGARYKNRYYVILRRVVESEGPTLICADTSDDMGVIKRINMMNAKKVNPDADNRTNVGGETANAIRKSDISDACQTK